MTTAPSVLNIPERTWTKIDSGLMIGTLYVLDNSFKYYKTYREVGGAAPSNAILPDDIDNFTGVRIFDNSIIDKLTFFGNVDLYIYCFNPDPDDADIGKILYFADEDKSSKKVDVFVQDQTTPFDDFFFVQQIGIPTDLTADTVFNTYTIDVASIADISIGDTIFIFSGISGENRFFVAEVLGISVLTLTLDRQMDFVYSIGDAVISATTDLNVDGSVTPQIFEIRAGGAGSDLEIDITRILIENLSASAVSLSTFGDIAGGILRGLQLRDKLSATEFKNKWNVKQNKDFALLGYDWDPFEATNPIFGQDGFKWRFTLAGQDKHGVAKRIGTDRSLQIIVQDNLTTLTTLTALGGNHEVD